MKTLTADSRELIKADVIAWVKAEMPNAHVSDQKDIVAATLKVIKSRNKWDLEQFSKGRRKAVEVFMARFSDVLDAEAIEDESALGALLEEIEGRLGSEGTDSSGLPLLSGSDKAVNYAYLLRSDWFGRRNAQNIDEARTELFENKTASYWITKLKN